MKLILNKYKRRILNQITELVDLETKLTALQHPYKQTLNPREYCSYALQISAVKEKIDLLKSLL